MHASEFVLLFDSNEMMQAHGANGICAAAASVLNRIAATPLHCTALMKVWMMHN